MADQYARLNETLTSLSHFNQTSRMTFAYQMLLVLVMLTKVNEGGFSLD